jgi:hypothetical protein
LLLDIQIAQNILNKVLVQILQERYKEAKSFLVESFYAGRTNRKSSKSRKNNNKIDPVKRLFKKRLSLMSDLIEFGIS